MKLYCYYDSADYEGCSEPTHYFSMDELVSGLSQGYGGDDVFVDEIDTEKSTVTRIFHTETRKYRSLDWDERGTTLVRDFLEATGAVKNVSN